MALQNKKPAEPGLTLVKGEDDPHAAMQRDVQQALSSLPKELRDPIANFVKKHVELELAPAPVTKLCLRTHAMICMICFGLITFASEFVRRSTINADTASDSLIFAAVVLPLLWLLAAGLSLVLRVQTRQFRINAVLLAVTLGGLSAFAAAILADVVVFYVQPRWLAKAVSGVVFIPLVSFWLHWYLRHALPTSRASLVKATVVGLGLLAMMAWAGRQYYKRDDLTRVETTTVLPYLPVFAKPVDATKLVDDVFAAARRKAKQE